MGSEGLNALGTAQFAALSSMQVASLSTEQVAALQSEDVGAIATAAMRGLGIAQLSAMTAEQFAALSTLQLGTLTSQQVSGIDSADLPSLGAGLSALSTAALRGLGSEQIVALDSDQVLGLSTAQLRALTTLQIAALESDEIAAFDAGQLQALGTAQVAAIETADFIALSSDSVQALTGAQVAALTTAQVFSLSSDQVPGLDTADIAGMRMDQVVAFNSSALAALSSAQLNALFLATPLVLDLDGDGVRTLAAAAGIEFDLLGDGRSARFGWVAGGDGLLAIDRNGDGVINDGRELFGSGTRLADGQRASDGYTALAEQDTDRDGDVDAQDAGFDALRVWVDANHDGRTDVGELKGLSELGIVRLDATPDKADEVDNGNWIGLRSSFTRADGSQHAMADVWFAKDGAQPAAQEVLAPPPEPLLEPLPVLGTDPPASLAPPPEQRWPQAQRLADPGDDPFRPPLI
jgi:trimeric autotransporter adhesin